MFSGLRSLLGFATTDENEPTATTSENDGQERENLPSVTNNDVINQLTLPTANLCTRYTNEIQAIEKSCFGPNEVIVDSKSGRSLKSSISNGSLQISADASRLLNAATTKFTEQLIVPPRPTIEQLQASSHQMLPDLGEMEESASRLSGSLLTAGGDVEKAPTKTNNMISTQNDVDSDDDNCSIDDSWELLDMDGDQKCTKEAKAKCEANAETREKENNINNNNNHLGGGFRNFDIYETVQVERNINGMPSEEEIMDSFVITGHGDDKQTNDDDNLIDVIDGKVISLDAVSIDDGSLTPESCDSNISPVRANKVGKKNQRKKKKNKANAKINLCDLVSKPSVPAESEEKLNVDTMTISLMSETNSVLLEPDWNIPKLHDWSIATTSSTKSKPNDPKVSIGCGATKAKKIATQGKTKPNNVEKDDISDPEKPIEYHPETGLKIIRACPILTFKGTPRKVETISPQEVREYMQVGDAKLKAELPRSKSIKESSPKKKSVEVKPEIRAFTPTLQQCNSSSDLQEVDSTSDWAVMDESWYVTPPPCFTGSKTKTSPSLLAKPNARENDLIEHPSIYMSHTASSSKNLPINGDKKCASNNSRKKNQTNNANNDSFLWVKKKSYFGSVIENVDGTWTRTPILDVGDPSEPILDRFRVSLNPQKKSSNKRRRDRKKAKRVATESTSSSSGDDKSIKFNKIARACYKREKVTWDEDSFFNDSDVFGDDSEYDPSQIDKDFTFEPMKVSPLSLNLRDTKVIKASPDTSSLDIVEEPEVVAKREPYIASLIEPERVPGWRLRRQRMNRKKPTKRVTKREPTKPGESILLSMQTPRERSSAMAMINRLGSSIFSNLTNLTTDLRTAVATAAVNSPPAVNPNPVEQQSLPGRAQVSDVLGVNEKLVAIQRKAETKRQGANSGRNQLNRQNECAKKGNSNRRLGRKTKMAQCQNGVSMNRKVQTNFH